MRRREHFHHPANLAVRGPGHSELSAAFRATGQPVLVGGSTVTAFFIPRGSVKGVACRTDSPCRDLIPVRQAAPYRVKVIGG